ncbi:hypothetical protein Y032_0096g2888 [Ancylostoma ceylanicum]|uniref:Secreted protein n=1 Tax=Ancylostoma ceylanicum TaxID=53326 RepID=A0A016TK23_9BILA|nr:hypothetical protein Y032_0096g2888 [Ancylostoma ceylanicum]
MNRLHLLLVFLVVFVKGSAVSADKERQHGHGHGQEREHTAVRIPVKAATTQLRYHEGWALVLGDLLPFSRKAMRFHKRRSSSKI